MQSSGLRILTAIDELAGILRDETDYAAAEQLYSRALQLRESALGPKDPELISTLDGLAYVLFGQQKHAEAEPVYLRLLDIWETSSGPEHPMVALTLDKIAEFYAKQGLFEKAAPYAERSKQLYSKRMMETLSRQGRILSGQGKDKEALDACERAVKIGDQFGAKDELMDPLLRMYSGMLKKADRKREAAQVDERIKNAILKRGEREGRRPVPPSAVPKTN